MNKLDNKELENKLIEITNQMKPIISKYNLDATEPLDVINNAKVKITNSDDYIQFIELALFGRLILEQISINN